MKKVLSIPIFILLLLLSCKDEPTSPETGNFNVSGVLYQDGSPVANTDIELKKADAVYQETKSDENGFFKFEEVARSEYTLVTKQYSVDGSFLESPTEINVTSDLYLESLILPKPVVLQEPVNNSTRSIELLWTKYSGNGFYEYKVYRHNSTALDETTGTLIHISTSPNDTSFTDEGQVFSDNGLHPNTTFFYRVYVNNQYGKMGGSNILETKTSQWESEENFTAFYELSFEKSFVTPRGSVSGLDSDGEYLWILVVESIGGYYTNNKVKIIKYDHMNDIALDTLTYEDEYIFPRSLIYAEGFLWVYYDDLMGPWINKIVPETGEIVQSFSCNTLEDMAYYGEYVYETRVAVDGDIIRKIRLSNYGLEDVFTLSVYDGIIDGITSRENELWITASFTNQIIILDSNNGNHIGVVGTENSSGGPGFCLCFIGNKLAYNDNGKINIYSITNIP